MKVIPWYNNQTQLLKLLRQEDRRAQQYVYRNFAPKMLGVCRQYIKDLQKAEDVLMQGFLKVFRRIDAFEDKGSFEGWIRRIMINESISYLRKTDRLQFQEYELEARTYNEDLDTVMDVARIQELIDHLPAGYRAVFVLYAIEGYKHQEIGEKLGISISTSKSQLFKARKMLQQQWKKQTKEIYGTQ